MFSYFRKALSVLIRLSDIWVSFGWMLIEGSCQTYDAVYIILNPRIAPWNVRSDLVLHRVWKRNMLRVVLRFQRGNPECTKCITRRMGL